MRDLVSVVLCLALALCCAAASGEEKMEPAVDVDLTFMSGNLLYAQVWQMMTTPGEYLDAVVKVRGLFSYYRDPDTGMEYFAALIPDAASCCAQGMEFVWEGEHTYPQDYPELDAEITVTGRFTTYEEYGVTYIQLADAVLEWDGE